MKELLKADFHIHTRYSMDCDTSLENIIERCQETGINCIAITDHNVLEGALEMQKLAPFTVIAAEEILTDHGEVIGMFLKEHVPSGLPIEEALSRIKGQDGLVCLPHPFDTLRGLRLNREKLVELLEQVDMIEIFNARSPLSRAADKALAFAVEHDLPGTAGSDAHTANEIGYTYIEMPAFEGQDDFLQALRKGRIHSQKANPIVHLNSTWSKIKSWLQV